MHEELLKSVEILISDRRRAEARAELLRYLGDQEPVDARVARLVSQAWGGVQGPPAVEALRQTHLNNLMSDAVEKKNYARILELAARYEAVGRNIPVAVGDLLARQLVSDVGIKRLGVAAQKALANAQRSPFVLYIASLTQATAGQYTAASANLAAQIEEVIKLKFNKTTNEALVRGRFDSLVASWRVVDAISREQMGWLDADKGASYADLVAHDQAQRVGSGERNQSMHFKEPLLQGRDKAGYLNFCRLEFESARTVIAKLRVIKEMLREGVRRELHYHDSYALGLESFRSLRVSLDDLVRETAQEHETNGGCVLAAKTVAAAIEVADMLALEDERDAFRAILYEWSEKSAYGPARWIIMATLVNYGYGIAYWGTASRAIRARLPNAPATEQDLRAYFQWALRMREFEEADEVYGTLTTAMKGSSASLVYINILQRQSRFTEALNNIKIIHRYMLSKPSKLSPLQHRGLLRRYGELVFLRETSNLFLSVRQPKKPNGVIAISARNIDQLRKYPIAALVEMKRLGWAVVSLVEGLLPREVSGTREIDALSGCITTDMEIRPDVTRLLPQVSNFDFKPTQGRLVWDGIDLSQAVLEDARILRRAFNVDLNCPSMIAYLAKLGRWTELFARVCLYTSQVLGPKGIPCGLMALFSSRLPDLLPRLFCQDRGDPENLFMLQTTNGYENYFRNFTAPISTRCVVRNMTRHPETRTSSMPLPDAFEAYFQANKGRVEDIINSIEKFTGLRRTTGGTSTILPEAAACAERLRAWRRRGGKVVCLFGRVVCDSSVPFDGGPAHSDLRDWLNHSIEATRGSKTLLMIKPHPHELNEQIATYLNEYFTDLIEVPMHENVEILGHKWLDVQSLKDLVDLGVIFNGTTAVDMALLEIPMVLAGHFGPIDYPVGHLVPRDRRHYEALITFAEEAKADPEMRARAAMWIEYMSSSGFGINYRFHARPITNKVVYPPYWIKEDVDRYLAGEDDGPACLAKRALGLDLEPGRDLL